MSARKLADMGDRLMLIAAPRGMGRTIVEQFYAAIYGFEGSASTVQASSLNGNTLTWLVPSRNPGIPILHSRRSGSSQPHITACLRLGLQSHGLSGPRFAISRSPMHLGANRIISISSSPGRPFACISQLRLIKEHHEFAPEHLSCKKGSPHQHLFLPPEAMEYSNL
jgi:hypothetical protein